MSYTGCGATQSVEASSIQLELSDAFEPLLARLDPTRIEFSLEDGESSDFFTLIFLDVGYTFLHMLVVNIPGDDVSQGEVLQNVNNTNVHIHVRYRNFGLDF